VRDGVLHRGVVSAEDPVSLVSCLDADKWVIMHCRHCARPPNLNPVTQLYQCDPFFAHALGDLPRVHAICRDFVDQEVYYPLGVEKQYDVIFNACWVDIKRPMLFVEALRYAKHAGRPISCIWYGYHWQLPSGDGTNQTLEEQIRLEASDLPVTFVPTDWWVEENNRRFNSARVAVLTSSAEGGPRVMPEAMLAGLPYLAAADVFGGSSAYLTADNKNGGLFATTPQAIAECIWRTLDTLGDFKPREWALANMCRTVAVARLQEALRRLERTSGFHINWQDADHDGRVPWGWWKPVIDADAVSIA
jgi:glycosyltransferase involved in cell wall biosynthesis